MFFFSDLVLSGKFDYVALVSDFLFINGHDLTEKELKQHSVKFPVLYHVPKRMGKIRSLCIKISQQCEVQLYFLFISGKIIII